jgi:serine/threonine protein kinase
LRQLEAIHEAGYTHGDIKPDNITIGQDPTSLDNTMRARLIDFGLSTCHKDEQKVDYFEGSIMFSSPHVMNLKPRARRDDLISLSYLLLYLMGELPFTTL